MKTSSTSSHSSPEPQQSPPEIKVSRVVRPALSQLSPSNGGAASSPVRPVLTAQSVMPPSSSENGGNDSGNGQLRLRSFSLHGVEHLPTATVPVPKEQRQSLAEQTPGAASANPQEMQAIQLMQERVPLEKQAAQPRPSPQVRGVNTEPVIQDGHVVLYRSTNFYVRTTNRRGQRPNPLRYRTGHTTLLPKIAPGQEQRVAGSETRMMPNIAPINPVQTKLTFPAWLEALFISIILLAALVAHVFNLAYFPHYELDEGTYMASAWAILHGMITPYPYGYGHPPVGWIQIAAWIQMTGGFFTFGNAISSGRVLMVLYALGSSLLVYLTIRRLVGSRSTAFLAMVIFSLSPLSIVFQRQVFLDNIATFWFLLSLFLLVVSNSRLSYIVLSAIAFGLALLSKEIFVIFIPVMIYGVWLHTTKFQRKFALVAFIYTVVSLGSTFVLMAVLKGELLPTGVLPWDHHPHLSMFDTFTQQAERGQSEGSFAVSWTEWMITDSLLLALSIGTPLFNLVMGWWNRKQLFLALLALTFWVLLVRGGVVFPFYFIPMIPLVAFNVAVALHALLRGLSKLTHLDALRLVFLGLVLVSIVFFDVKQTLTYTDQRPATAQVNALLWIRNHVPQNSFVVINSYFYTDLHEPGGEGIGNGAGYPYAHIYWNVAYDPELHDQLLQNNWDRIDYIVTDSNMLNDIKTHGGPMTLITDALNHSVLRAEFQSQDRDQHVDIQIYQVIHKGASQIIGLMPPPSQAHDLLSSGSLSFTEPIFTISNRRNT